MLDGLLILQEIDIEIDKLNKQLSEIPEKLKKSDLLMQIGHIEMNKKDFQTRLKKVNLSQDKIEEELKLLVEKIEKENSTLYSGNIGNPKELANLQSELLILANKKEKIENEMLSVMEQASDIEKMIDEYEKREEASSLRAEALDELINDKEMKIKEQLEILAKKRSNQARDVNTILLKEYEELRAKNEGVAITTLVDGACHACIEKRFNAKADVWKFLSTRVHNPKES